MLRRLRLTFLFIPVAFLALAPVEDLLSRVLQSGHPIAHEIRSGESLSRLAEEYYGDASFWRELALVNRAPNPSFVLPGERLLVPSLESIERIRQARTFSEVNRAMLDIRARMTAGPDLRPRANVSAGSPTGPKPTGFRMPSSREAASEAISNRWLSTGGLLWGVLVPATFTLALGAALIWRHRRRDDGDQADLQPMPPLRNDRLFTQRQLNSAHARTRPQREGALTEVS